jgi:hypothetical protein
MMHLPVKPYRRRQQTSHEIGDVEIRSEVCLLELQVYAGYWLTYLGLNILGCDLVIQPELPSPTESVL